MAFELPDLPFEKEALAPWTSAETLEFHHGKHHAGYVKKLNAAVEGTDLADKPLEEVIAASRGNPAVFNSAAQHWNHAFFWTCLSPDGGKPEGELAELVDRDFGGLDAFKEAFAKAALGHFGSGWAWLVQDGSGTLHVKDYHDADTPAGTDMKPLLTLDVWEHAYYIDYRNDRGAFVEGFWNHVNWSAVNERLG